MITSKNPYQSPECTDSPAATGNWDLLDKSALIAWPLAFGANSVLAQGIVFMVTKDHGRIGMACAMLILLASGWVLCIWRRPAARGLIVGTAIVAISQVFPIIHLFACWVGSVVVYLLDLADTELDDEIQVPSVLGGFLATAVVGFTLIICSGGIGLLVSCVLPRHWLSQWIRTGLP